MAPPQHAFHVPQSASYFIFLGAGLALTLTLWSRMAQRDPRLLGVYLGAVLGAFAGAKLIFILAEAWAVPPSTDPWLFLATGKSITGALLGGYAGVEIAKNVVRYHRPTGDRFALLVPLGVILGRIGCLAHGCCLGSPISPSCPVSLDDHQGVSRWPAVPAEIIFNALALLIALVLDRRKTLPGQHFHLYLAAYGIFRFTHEFLRATPKASWGLSGYQLASLALLALAVIRFRMRATSQDQGTSIKRDGNGTGFQRPVGK